MSILAPQYVQGVYIPSSLLIVGTMIIKREWVPYAVLLAVALGSWKIYINSMVYNFFRRKQYG